MMVTLEIVARRCYLVNLPYAKKDEAKHTLGMTGNNWDADRRQWWVSVNKKRAAQNYVDHVNRGVEEATSASKKQAVLLGLEPDTPACVVADALADKGEEGKAAALRHSMSDKEIDASRVFAKVRHVASGQVYYVIAESHQSQRCLVTTLDRKTPEWKDMADFVMLRRYQPRKVNFGRNLVHQTVGGLRGFREKQANPATATGECSECGTWGPKGEVCRDCQEGTHQ